jgi:hypothetical protein
LFINSADEKYAGADKEEKDSQVPEDDYNLRPLRMRCEIPVSKEPWITAQQPVERINIAAGKYCS